MKNLIWLPFAPIWWFYQLLLKIPTALLGLFVVPFLWRYRYTQLDMLPFWAIPWANPEDWHGGTENYDGSLPHWWKIREGDGKWAFYKYHAIRNPADGLRNFEKLNLKINKDSVYYWTPTYYRHYEPWHVKKPALIGYVAGQNVWVGVKLQWIRSKTYSELKFGFRVEPADAHHELAPDSARRLLGASFASKLILNREWK